jgi:hypothetical protein
MAAVDPRRSRELRPDGRMSLMDFLLVLILIAVLGLFAQAAGADSRDVRRGRAA